MSTRKVGPKNLWPHGAPPQVMGPVKCLPHLVKFCHWESNGQSIRAYVGWIPKNLGAHKPSILQLGGIADSLDPHMGYRVKVGHSRSNAISIHIKIFTKLAALGP